MEYKTLLIISPYLENKELFLKTLKNDIFTIEYVEQNVDFIIDFITNNSLNLQSLNIGFIYHSDLTNNMPFFIDNTKSNYNFFSNTFIDFLNKTSNIFIDNKINIHLITPNDCNDDFYNEINNLHNSFKNIHISHSLHYNKNTSSYNWLLESDNIDLTTIYFNSNIHNWNYKLSLLSYNTLQGHFGPIFDNNRTRIFHLKDFEGNPISQLYDNKNRNIQYTPSKVFIEDINTDTSNNLNSINKSIVVDDIVSIYPNTYAFAAIKKDGSVFCWGNKEYGGAVSGSGGKGTTAWNGPSNTITKETPLYPVVSIYATKNAFAALLNNGSVSCWGNKINGGTTPRNIMNVKEIYSTESAFCALKYDGSIQCWGNKINGGSTPTNYKNITAIYSNSMCFTALYNDGSIFSWGNSQYGGSLNQPINNVKYVIGNYGSFTALKTNGTIQSWGNYNYGGSTPKGLNYVKDIYSTGYAYCALKNDGTIYCWGNTKYGGSNIDKKQNYGFIQIYATQDSFCGLRNDGSIFCWGAVNYIPDVLDNNIKAIYSNYVSFGAIYGNTNNFIYWGPHNQTHNKKLKNVVKADGGLYSMTVLLENGEVYNWGYDTGIKHIKQDNINTINLYSNYNQFTGLNNNIDSIKNKRNYTDKQLYNDIKGTIINGKNKFLESNNSFTNLNFNNQWTIEFEFRIKPDYLLNDPIYILNKNSFVDNNIIDNEFSIIYEPKTNVLKIHSYNNQQISKPSKLLVVKDNDFHHYTYTYDGNSLKGYRDGKLILNKSVKNLNLTQTHPNSQLFIGNIVDDSIDKKQTVIELYYLRIWSVVKTKEDIIYSRNSEFQHVINNDLLFNCYFTDYNLDLNTNKFNDFSIFNTNVYYHGSIIDDGLLNNLPLLNNLILYYNANSNSNIIKNNFNLFTYYDNINFDKYNFVNFSNQFAFSTLLHNIQTISLWYKFDNYYPSLFYFDIDNQFNFDTYKLNKSSIFSNSQIYINGSMVKEHDSKFNILMFNKLGFNQNMNELVNITIVFDKPINQNLQLFYKEDSEPNSIYIGDLFIYNSKLEEQNINDLFHYGFNKYEKVFELIKQNKIKLPPKKQLIDKQQNISLTIEENDNYSIIDTVIEIDSVDGRSAILKSVIDNKNNDIGNLDDIYEETIDEEPQGNKETGADEEGHEQEGEEEVNETEEENEQQEKTLFQSSIDKPVERAIVDNGIFIDTTIIEPIKSRLLIIASNIGDIDDLRNSVNQNTQYIIDSNITIEDLMNNVNITTEYIAFVYHSNFSNNMPFFKDNKNIKPTYDFFTDNFIEMLINLKMKSPNIIVDLLACNLKHPKFKKEIQKIQHLLDITIRYSFDETGNNKDGGDWIMESHNVDIKPIYFTDFIINWDTILNIQEPITNDLNILKSHNINNTYIDNVTKQTINNNDELIDNKFFDTNNNNVLHSALNIMFKQNSNIKSFKTDCKNLCLENRIKEKYVKVAKAGTTIDLKQTMTKDTGIYLNLSSINDFVIVNHNNNNYIFNKYAEDSYEIINNEETKKYVTGEKVEFNGYTFEFGGASGTGQTGSGSSGDPYINTLNGKKYKLKDKPGYYRIYEGVNIIINAETNLISDLQKNKINDYGLNMDGLITKGTLYSKLYIKNENEECIIDLNKGHIIMSRNNKSFILGNDKITYSNFDLYNNIKCLTKPLLIKNNYHENIVLQIELFDIPQIENGFNLYIERQPVNQIGLIVDTYKEKNMKLKSLSSNKSKLNKKYKIEKKPHIKHNYESWVSINSSGNVSVC